jgi:hypothetical protein
MEAMGLVCGTVAGGALHRGDYQPDYQGDHEYLIVFVISPKKRLTFLDGLCNERLKHSTGQDIVKNRKNMVGKFPTLFD